MKHDIGMEILNVLKEHHTSNHPPTVLQAKNILSMYPRFEDCKVTRDKDDDGITITFSEK